MTALEQRLVELEMRLSFQEHAMGELSDALAAARDEGNRTSLLLHRALDDLKQLRGAFASDLAGDPGGEPPPPHY